jgi:hypothetical protein
MAVELEPELPSDAPLATEEPADFDEWGGFGMTKKDKKRIKQRDPAMAVRHDRSTMNLPQLGLDVAVMSPLPTSSLIDHHGSADRNEYTAVLFCHAKLTCQRKNTV